MAELGYGWHELPSRLEDENKRLREALGAWVELDERWNATSWDNEQEYNAEYRRIFTEARDALEVK